MLPGVGMGEGYRVFTVTKEKLANLYLPFLPRCPISPRFCSGLIPKASPNCYWSRTAGSSWVTGPVRSSITSSLIPALLRNSHSCLCSHEFLIHSFIHSFTEPTMSQALARSSHTEMGKTMRPPGNLLRGQAEFTEDEVWMKNKSLKGRWAENGDPDRDLCKVPEAGTVLGFWGSAFSRLRSRIHAGSGSKGHGVSSKELPFQWEPLQALKESVEWNINWRGWRQVIKSASCAHSPEGLNESSASGGK